MLHPYRAAKNATRRPVDADIANTPKMTDHVSATVAIRLVHSKGPSPYFQMPVGSDLRRDGHNVHTCLDRRGPHRKQR